MPCPSTFRLLLSRLMAAALATMLVCSGMAAAQQAPGGAAGIPQEQQAELIDKALNEWYESTRQIQSLVGEHRRFIYDYVFNVEKRAEGRFYYTAPDKGRIDLMPSRVEPDQQTRKLSPVDNKPVTLSVQPDISTQWVCDGHQILVVDNVEKSVQQYRIPKESQGVNIMNGPMPFLFGMPPDQARERYSLRILKMDQQDIDFVVIPKWQSDAANYQWARVRLERSSMLPKAVQMVDPAGTRETVYTFPSITKNPAKGGLFDKLKFWKEKDPFKPELRGYRFLSADSRPVVDSGRPAVSPSGGTAVPSVVGFDYKQAEQLLKRAGFEVKFRRGPAAPRKQLVFRVIEQKPKPQAVGTPGQIVWLTLYTPQVKQTSGEAASDASAAPEPRATGGTAGNDTPARDSQSARPAVAPAVKPGATSRTPTMPRLAGAFWKEAQKPLQAAGVKAQFVKGRPAPTPKHVYHIYEQVPAPGTPLRSGQTVTLKVYVPADKPK